jgi:release factor glutamine methyltransferase
MTLRELLMEAAARIARRDAEVMAQHVLARDRAWLLAHPEAEIADKDAGRLRALVARRAAQEPLQHLTGVQEFFGLPLEVNGDVLIPRPETELLVEAVLEWVRGRDWKRPPVIVDVGTGSGAIAIALARELPDADVHACDKSLAALRVARRNAQRHEARVTFAHSDLLSGYRPGMHFDVIVSNPPYVALADAPTLAHEVVAHEPHVALFAGEDGLEVYRRLLPQSAGRLTAGGVLAMEFGFGQRDELRETLEEHRGADDVRQWTSPRFLDDYAGIPRVVLVERRGADPVASR